jgi:hypothetical protein
MTMLVKALVVPETHSHNLVSLVQNRNFFVRIICSAVSLTSDGSDSKIATCRQWHHLPCHTVTFALGGIRRRERIGR